MQVKTASGPLLWWMKWKDFTGYTSIFGQVYVAPGWEDCQWLLRHEFVHVQQVKRYGVLGFWARNLWYNLTVGYQKNPLEVEARLAEPEQ